MNKLCERLYTSKEVLAPLTQVFPALSVFWCFLCHFSDTLAHVKCLYSAFLFLGRKSHELYCSLISVHENGHHGQISSYQHVSQFTECLHISPLTPESQSASYSTPLLVCLTFQGVTYSHTTSFVCVSDLAQKKRKS